MSNRNVYLGIGIGCGALLLLTLMCGGAGYYFVRSAVSVSGEASQATDAFFRHMTSGTAAESYQTLTTPEFRGQTSQQAYEQMAAQIRTQLGPLRSKTMARINLRQQNASSLADVVYQARFEKGSGTINLTFKRTGGKWLVQGFRVDSAALMKGIPSETCLKCGGTYAAGARFCPHCGAALSNKDKAE
jgi:hypothetical protein